MARPKQSFEQHIGARFGRLVVLAEISGTPRKFRAVCDCGAQKDFVAYDVLRKAVISCGCYRKQLNTTHMMHATTEYRSWNHMLQRCTNPANSGYADYGGRGIRVCERWLLFENFIADMGSKPYPNYSIDRKDNDGNYEPNNCRWASSLDQMHNTRKSRRITFNGRTMCLREWARELGIDHKTLAYRIKSGWPNEKAFMPKL